MRVQSCFKLTNQTELGSLPKGAYPLQFTRFEPRTDAATCFSSLVKWRVQRNKVRKVAEDMSLLAAFHQKYHRSVLRAVVHTTTS